MFILVSAAATGRAQAINTSDLYTSLNTAWGWKDFLKPYLWDDVAHKRCEFVSPEGTLKFSVRLATI